MSSCDYSKKYLAYVKASDQENFLNGLYCVA